MGRGTHTWKMLCACAETASAAISVAFMVLVMLRELST